MKRKVPIKRLLLLLFALILMACVALPIPYYIEAPGSTIKLDTLVKVNDQKDKFSGSFSLTSVGIRQATVATALFAKTQSFSDLVTKEELMGSASNDDYNRIQNFYMESSQNNAITAALNLAEKPFKMDYLGVYVLGIEPNSAFYGQIKIGDTVVQVDSKAFKSSDDFMKYVQSKKVGDQVTITYLQDGKEKKASGALIKLPTNGKAGIGITLTDHTKVNSQEKVQFDVDNIGGPSAGLMFTLEIYQQLIKQDLRNGHEIAGTGTIDSEGNVGQIGGIDKKVVSASESGAEVFFAPADLEKGDTNYRDAKKAAKKIKTKMKIVPVKTAEEAVKYLKEHVAK
ncbi:lon-like protease [Enterococcus sp. DIV0755b]|uniref:SepM family pheromone-processing serine protease n=1 Tax=Enterococcus sp. DIV0755b TaxID=2774657 RepID=UPI003F25CF4E